MRCPWLLAALSRSRGATERPESCPATIPGDNTVFDASPLQVLTGENLKQRHARTSRPLTADLKSNPGSPYQRHEGTPRPDAASPCAGELIAASCICFIAGGVGRGVGILLAVLSIVAMLLGSCWAGLLPVCVAVLQLVQTPDSPLPPAHTLLPLLRVRLTSVCPVCCSCGGASTSGPRPSTRPPKQPGPAARVRKRRGASLPRGARRAARPLLPPRCSACSSRYPRPSGSRRFPPRAACEHLAKCCRRRRRRRRPRT